MKQFTGVVVSTKMAKTATVLVEKSWMHPVYQKAIKRTKKYLVHDTLGAKLGQTVIFETAKPISKRKRFKIVSIAKSI